MMKYRYYMLVLFVVFNIGFWPYSCWLVHLCVMFARFSLYFDFIHSATQSSSPYCCFVFCILCRVRQFLCVSSHKSVCALDGKSFMCIWKNHHIWFHVIRVEFFFFTGFFYIRVSVCVCICCWSLVCPDFILNSCPFHPFGSVFYFEHKAMNYPTTITIHVE